MRPDHSSLSQEMKKEYYEIVEKYLANRKRNLNLSMEINLILLEGDVSPRSFYHYKKQNKLEKKSLILLEKPELKILFKAYDENDSEAEDLKNKIEEKLKIKWRSFLSFCRKPSKTRSKLIQR